MNEKKLTDEDIIKAFEECNNGKCKGCAYRTDKDRCKHKKLNGDILDLIRRLQYDNSSAHKASEEWREKYEKERKEIEKLHTLTDLQEANVNTTFENNMKLRKEIERLEKQNGVLLCAKDAMEANCIEFQKQVDELKEERENMQAEILATEERRLQSVKDTAKEILQGLIEKAYSSGCIDLTVNEVKAWFREDYGVEVE